MAFVYEPIPGVIEATWDGKWKCGKCDYVSERWNSVLGHQGRHSEKKKRPVGKKGNLRGKEPLDMTFGEMIATIEELRTTLADAEKRARTAESKFNRARSLFSSVSEEDGPDQT